MARREIGRTVQRVRHAFAGTRLFDDLQAGRIAPRAFLEEVSRISGWPFRAPNGDTVFAIPVPAGAGPSSVVLHDPVRRVRMQRVGGLAVAVVAELPTDCPYTFRHSDGREVDDRWSRHYAHGACGPVALTKALGAHLERWFGVTDGNVAPRTVRVRVPAYGTSATHVLFVNDGQSLFDPRSMGGGWHLDEQVADSTLVVGIDNTIDRFDEYTMLEDDVLGGKRGGRGQAYVDFVENTVRPMMTRIYGIRRDARYGLLGASLGGLIALEHALRYPERYDFVGSLSGTVTWGVLGMQNPTVIDRYRERAPLGITLYLDSGGYIGVPDVADGSDNCEGNAEMAAMLGERGYRSVRPDGSEAPVPGQPTVAYFHEPGALHGAGAWRARLWRPLSLFESLSLRA